MDLSSYTSLTRKTLPGPGGRTFRGRSRRRPSSRRGSALIATLFVVIAVSVMSVAYLQLSLSKNREGRASVDAKAAFYMAEAGISESFTAIRMGRSGNVGTAEVPAQFANGVFWVEAEEQSDGTCRLRSTGLCGSGRSSLSVIVDKTESSVPSLGIFGDGDITIGEGALLDSYDSRVSPFGQQGYDPGWYSRPMGAPADLEGPAQPEAPRVGQAPVSPPAPFGAQLGSELGGPAQMTLGGGGASAGTATDTSQAQDQDYNLEEWADHAHEMQDPEHLPRSAKLTANGDVTVLGATPGSVPTRVFGAIRPGPDGTVTAEPGTLITGSTTPADDRVLPPVIKVPTLASRGDHTVQGLHRITNTEASYGVLHAPAGTVLSLEGPLKIVVDELWIDPGATLRIDTTAGPVEFYATDYFGVLDGSSVVSVETKAEKATFIVTGHSWVDRDADGQADSPAELSPSGAFYGIVYAPHADLTIDADLHFFGSLAADNVTLESGAHVTFDVALESIAAGPLAIPKLGAWRMVELPTEEIVRTKADPILWLTARGVTPTPAHLAYKDAILTITFRCVDNHVHTYEGPKHLFDMAYAQTILSINDVPAPAVGRMTAPTADDYHMPNYGHAEQDELSPFTNVP